MDLSGSWMFVVYKDAVLQAKDDTQQLQSVFRRRRGDDSGFANEVKSYLASRKKANKLINKSLKDLKISKCVAHNDVETTCSMLRDVEGVTFSVLESVFSYMTASMPEPKSTNWSLVSKSMHSKHVTCGGRASTTNEFERVSATLSKRRPPRGVGPLFVNHKFRMSYFSSNHFISI
ncbi:uncharacterized protein LOC120183214 [Hibiscus syriacus]|uniref:uncharacterized protein LOC120183214 n=1 Tax=Hibiscus syriacus TaxID=106335 RepID=UPI001921D886|nr:uncharacterized protein LOC120183214 [Hibiscus syriacus]